MRQLEIRLAHGKRKMYRGPAGWNEIPSARLYRKLYRTSRIGYALPKTKFIALRLVYRMPERVSKLFFAGTSRHKRGENDLLDRSDREVLLGAALLDTVSWIWKELPNRRWHYKRLRVLWRRYTGPDDEFRGMTFGQFMFTERAWEDTLSPKHYQQGVLSLVAALYVRKGKEFDTEKIAATTRWLRWIPGDLQEAIAHNYQGLRHQLTLDFPEVFSEPEEGTSRNPQSASPTQAGWLDIALSLAGDDLAKLYQYEKADLWLVMKVLQKAMIRNRELAEMYEK